MKVLVIGTRCPRTRPVPLSVPRPGRHRAALRPRQRRHRARSPSCTPVDAARRRGRRRARRRARRRPGRRRARRRRWSPGVADAVRAAGIPVLRPVRARPPRLEGSKAFAKEVMAAAGRAHRAGATSARRPSEVAEALDAFGAPYVVKDDGLAAGKGVVVTDDRRRGARPRAGAPGRARRPRGHRGVPRRPRGVPVRHDRRRDGRPARPRPGLQARARRRRGPQHRRHGRVLARCRGRPQPGRRGRRRASLQPTVDEMARRGTPFSGLLYVGLAITSPRRTGHRVQRPLRRPRDPGRPGPARDAAGRRAARRRDRARSPACRRCAGATTPR